MLNLASDETGIKKLIESLNDKNQSADAKKEAIHKLNIIKVFSPVLNKLNVELTNALRGLIDNPDDTLRLQAFGMLASMKDEVVQDKLREQLESGDNTKTKIPNHQAIAMLGIDEKALDQKLLTKIIQNPPDDKALIEAIRYAPANNETVGALLKVMQDESKPLEARSLIPDLIGNVDPKSFLDFTNKHLQEKGINDDLVPSLIKGLASIQKTEAKPDLEKTKALLKKLLQKGPKQLSDDANDILFSK